MTPILQISGLNRHFSGLKVTDDVSLSIDKGELRALIGPNGAGKTTLLNQVAGELRQESGSIRLSGTEIGGLPAWQRARRGLARTFQIVQLLPRYSALENVALAVQAQRGHSFRFLSNARGNTGIEQDAMALLHQVGLSAYADYAVEDLGQGQCKQLELAIALAAQPTVLLLDEPMAGLSPGESKDMVELLSQLKGRLTMVLVEHDMDAVFALADRISVLIYGRIEATGTVDEIRNNAVVRSAYLGEGDD